MFKNWRDFSVVHVLFICIYIYYKLDSKSASIRSSTYWLFINTFLINNLNTLL